MSETLRVLIVEDEPSHAEAMLRAFAVTRPDCAVEVCTCLAEYRAAIAVPPHIALLDRDLPDGSALEVLAGGSTGAFPVLIMTSFGDERSASEVLEAGALDHIVKSPEIFASIPHFVDRALREWSLLRTQERQEARILHLNSVLRGIRGVNQAITQAREPIPLLQEACVRLVDSMGYRTAWIALVEGGVPSLAALAGSTGELANILVAHIESGSLPECARSALEAPGVHSHVFPRLTCREAGLDHSGGTCGVLAGRLQHRASLYGVMVAAVPVEFVSDEEERSLFQDLVRDLSAALSRIDLEQRHEEAARRLAESEARYRELVENLEDVVISTDLVGRVRYVSPAIQRLYGYTPEEVVGRAFAEFVHPDDAGLVLAGFRRTLQGQTEPNEFRGLAKDGSVRRVRATARVQLENGQPAGVAGIISDLTAQVEAVRAKQQLEQRLEVGERLEAIGRLAGGVAHDFNNLLSVILSYTRFGIDQLHASDPLRADLVEVEQAAKRAATLTRQLLAFSRRQVMAPEVVNLNQTVRGLETMLRRLLGEDIGIDINLADDLGSVLADPGQLDQVLMNLAINARDAMPMGGRLIIETANSRHLLSEGEVGSIASEKPCVVLSVADTGIGMDAATQQHIFEPFYTTKSQGKGTGLGLSIVYGIVKQSGGDISLASEPGQGATFKVFLPRIDSLAGDQRRRTDALVPRGTETILVVEDEEPVRRLAERILRGAGYRVHSAASGGDALLLWEEIGSSVDLLLTDVVMPQMSGRQLAERLSAGRSLPVVYMSGYADDAIIRHGVFEPGTRFVGKPFSLNELRNAVREVLDDAKRAGTTRRGRQDS